MVTDLFNFNYCVCIVQCKPCISLAHSDLDTGVTLPGTLSHELVQLLLTANTSNTNYEDSSFHLHLQQCMPLASSAPRQLPCTHPLYANCSVTVTVPHAPMTLQSLSPLDSPVFIILIQVPLWYKVQPYWSWKQKLPPKLELVISGILPPIYLLKVTDQSVILCC